jgi:hypothetical protein
MKKGWKIAGIAVLVAILGLAGVSAIALAQGADTGASTPFDFATKFREALASALGISVDDYSAAVDKAEQQVVDQAVTEGWLTQQQADVLKWPMDQEGAGIPGLGKGFGMMRGGDMGGPMGLGMAGSDSLYSIAADKLGMKLTELLTALQSGKSIADVAKEKGVDIQTIVDAYVAKVKETLDQSVASGSITQKQADYQLEQITTRVKAQIANTGLGRFMHGGRHGEGMGSPDIGGF